MPQTPLPPPTIHDDLPARSWPRWTGWVAWGVILAVCLALPLLRSERKEEAAEGVAGPQPVDLQTKLAGRYAVGTAKLMPGPAAKMADALATAAPTDEGRIAAAVVAGELVDADEAARQLRAIDDPDAAVFLARYAAATTRPAAESPGATMPTSVPATTISALPATSPSTRPDLHSLEYRFGWFARLADVYGRPDADPERAAVLAEARQTVVAVVGAFALVAGAGVVGLGLLVTAVVLIATGKLHFAVHRPAGPAAVYVEAVAVYLGGFVAVSLLIGYLVPDATLALQVLGLGGVVVLAAVWPLLRGVPWGVLRRDWGVHAGRGVFLELLAGVGGYVAGLPLVFLGVGATVLLLRVGHTDATHPITQQIDSGSVVLLYGVAAVFAPLTEELLFRGALVSHLRRGVGVAAAAAISGLVFAAVHPQGWAAIPALGTIGAVLALIRQWRGTLLASMAAHALNNAFVVTLLSLAVR